VAVTGGATGSLGNPNGDDGDSDSDPLSVPSRCNVSDDCPSQYHCVSHACRPVSQIPPEGGCATAPGLGLAALGALGLAALGLRRRRR
jgi:MYXO-CTERM domain-containing protein